MDPGSSSRRVMGAADGRHEPQNDDQPDAEQQQGPRGAEPGAGTLVVSLGLSKGLSGHRLMDGAAYADMTLQ